MPSSQVRISIRNQAEVEAAFMRLPPAVRRGTTFGLFKVGGMTRDHAKQLVLQGPKTGKKYKKLPNRSSAPGEPPADQSGALVRSITSRFDRATFSVTVSAGTFYAYWLEFGTRNMAARPFLTAALGSVRGLVAQVLGYDIKAEIKKVVRR